MTLDNRKLADLLAAQQFITSEIALGKPLAEILAAICLSIEAILATSRAHSSILLLKNNKIIHGAAPSLPHSYSDALVGLAIGPNVGSCGTAMFTGKQTIVSNINTDPLWKDYKALALQHNLQSCWSTPIKSNTDKILGSFAIYYEYPAEPSNIELELIQHFSYLSKLAIQNSMMHAELHRTNVKLSTLTNVLPDLAIVVNEAGEFIDIFGADDSLLSAGTRDLMGQKVADLLPPALADDVLKTIERSLSTRENQTLEYDLNVGKGQRTFEGRVTPIEQYLADQPDTRHVLWMARDITDEKIAEQKIENLAFYDPLTDLPNRRLLLDRLKSQIQRARRNNKTGALLYLDLDDFKRINDSLGHSVGDKLLRSVANRLTPTLRKADTLARIGGDEFVVVLDDLKDNPADTAIIATDVANKIIKSLQQAFEVEAYRYRIGVSIGISLIESSDETTDEILKRADAAMYRSKKTSGSSVCFFNPSLQEKLDKQLAMERLLIAAIDTNQFTAHFQPQVNKQGKLVAAEALIRWLSPEIGYVPPMDFIHVAEHCGLIKSIQNTVLHESCKLLSSMQSANLLDDDFQISINISASQFKLDNLMTDIQTVIKQYNIAPTRIMLEITESMLVDDIEDAIEQMKTLRNLGFSIAIDDFGIGFSSLSYLQNFPVNQLKIDKSFIDKIAHGGSDIAIVDAIIALATHMNFDIIAEGIEHKEQATLLSNRAINAMQGYYFSRPIAADAFLVWCAK